MVYLIVLGVLLAAYGICLFCCISRCKECGEICVSVWLRPFTIIFVVCLLLLGFVYFINKIPVADGKTLYDISKEPTIRELQLDEMKKQNELIRELIELEKEKIE